MVTVSSGRRHHLGVCHIVQEHLRKSLQGETSQILAWSKESLDRARRVAADSREAAAESRVLRQEAHDILREMRAKKENGRP